MLEGYPHAAVRIADHHRDAAEDVTVHDVHISVQPDIARLAAVDQDISGDDAVELPIRRELAPWLLGLPMFDMAAVLVERAVVRRSVVRADRSHIHHLLMGRGISKNSVLGILLLFQSISCTIAILGFYLKVADWIFFWAVFPALVLYIVFRAWLRGGVVRS